MDDDEISTEYLMLKVVLLLGKKKRIPNECLHLSYRLSRFVCEMWNVHAKNENMCKIWNEMQMYKYVKNLLSLPWNEII